MLTGLGRGTGQKGSQERRQRGRQAKRRGVKVCVNAAAVVLLHVVCEGGPDPRTVDRGDADVARVKRWGPLVLLYVTKARVLQALR